jgi:hypothetical protein
MQFNRLVENASIHAFLRYFNMLLKLRSDVTSLQNWLLMQSKMQFDQNVENASINVFLRYFNMLSMLRVIKKILLM